MSSRSRPVCVWVVALLVAFGLLAGHGLVASAAPAPPAPTAASAPSPSAAPAPTPSPSCEGSVPQKALCEAGKVLGAAKDAAGAALGAVAGSPGALASAATGNITGAVADAAEASFTHWVAEGASWVLGQIAGFITSVTSPDVTAQWFTTHYRTMWQIAVLFLVPFLLAAVVQGLLRQDPGLIVGSVARVPAAFILAAGAVTITAIAVQATDELTAVVTGTIGHDTAGFLTNVGSLVLASSAGGPTALVFVALGSLLTVVAGIVVYLELLVRTVMVYTALLFLPLGLAAIVWPRARHWAVRLTEVLAAAVVSKFLIAAVLSLAVAGMSGEKGSTFPSVILGAVLLGMAAFAPYGFLRMLPLMEASAIHAIRGRGGARVVRETYFNAQGVWDRIAHDQSARVAAFHRWGQGQAGVAKPAAAGAGAAAGVAAVGLAAAERARRSASGTRDALSGSSSAGSTSEPAAGRSTPPPPPPTGGTEGPLRPKGGGRRG